MRIDVYVHIVEGSHTQLDRIERLIHTVIEKENSMAGELDALRQQVANNTAVIESAITLIRGIKAALDAAIASGDPAALTALSSQLGADDAALAEAVAQNTPASP